MKRSAVLVVIATVAGCFGRQGAVVIAPSVSPTPVMQETITVKPTPQVTASTIMATPTSTPALIVAQDSETNVTDIRVGDPALETAIRFTVDKAGSVAVHQQTMSGLRLFRVRADQYGQTELISELKGGEAVIPEAGAFEISGKEKALPFRDVPMGGIVSASQYRFQTAECSAQTRHIERSYGGYPASIAAWTRDTEFPAKAKVYLHRGGGNSVDPVDSFQNWVNYNHTRSPDKAALAERVREYVPDPWDSAPAPDEGADAFNTRRINCGTKGELWLDACHSAGCNKVRLALLREWYDRWNNIGGIAVAPAFSGSHHAIKQLFDAAISKQNKSVRWSIVRAIIQREWEQLLPQRIVPQDIVAIQGATRYYNRGLRALAWTGIGTGIPTQTYSWFSTHVPVEIPFLKLPLKPEVRYTMPTDNPLNNYARTRYTWPADGEMFNYIDAVNALDELIILNDGSRVTDGTFDVAVCYLNGDLRPAVEYFEKKYSKDSLLELLWRAEANAEYRRQFVQDVLPWLASLTAQAPSVVPSAPKPNENSAGDGMLTLCQQIGCEEGSSILSPESEYGRLIINKSVVEERKPRYVGVWKDFPGRNHKDAVSGEFDGDGKKDGDQELWDWMNSRLIFRIDRIREQERTYVLTDSDKKRILETLGPRNGEETIYSDWDTANLGGMHRTKTVYRLYSSKVEWIQDPLNEGRRNRIRVAGSGTMTVDVYRFRESVNTYVYDFQASKSSQWNVDEDFIARQGALLLVIKN